MNISLIAAFSKNLVIGYRNKIPWHLPEDLKWFKKNTINKSIIMGRVTWESMGRRPLPMRKNIVISRKKIANKEIIWANSIYNAIILSQYDKEVMVIGGSEIYNQMILYAQKLYLTHIDIETIGDSYFPQYKLLSSWKVIFKKKFKKNNTNPYNYFFEILSK